MSEERSCGPCDACCRALAVASIEGCDAGKRCPHQRIGRPGCKIYESRFDICRTYKCLWLRGAITGKELRPDKVGLIFDEGETPQGTRIIRAHETYEGKANSTYAIALLKQVAFASRHSVVVFSYGVARFIVRPEGSLEAPVNGGLPEEQLSSATSVAPVEPSR